MLKRKNLCLTLLTVVFVLTMGLAIAHADSPFTWFPRLGNVTTQSIEVVYQTTAEADTYVQYALKSEYDAKQTWSSKTAAQRGKLFRVQLSGLTPDSQYVYQVCVDGKPASDVRSFYTAPEKPMDFTFLAYGDTRTYQDKQKLVCDKMALDPQNPRLVFHVGDLVDNGSQTDLWPDFAVAVKELWSTMPAYVAIGNHEYFSDNYYKNLALPQNGGGQFNSEWYSFDYAGVHFIVLDTNILDKYTNPVIPDAVAKQYEWLNKDLEAHKDTKWIVAVFHHPIYSSHKTSRYPKLQKELIPIFDKYGVDLILNGHNHIYERVLAGGRNYITTGGGGAPFDYVWDYTPRLAESVAIEDAMLEYTRVRVTADKLYVDVIQTHEEADDFSTLNENFKIIDHVEIEDIKPVK